MILVPDSDISEELMVLTRDRDRVECHLTNLKGRVWIASYTLRGVVRSNCSLERSGWPRVPPRW